LGGAGVGRCLKFAKYLCEGDWQTIVISASENVSYEKDYSLLSEIPDKAEVHSVWHQEYRWKELKYLCNKLRIDFDFPDAFKTWCCPAYQEAKRILEQDNVGLIFSSSAPYTSHFVGMKLKSEFNKPWIADFRDPWSGNDVLNLWHEKSLILPLRKIVAARIKKAERKILATADKTIVASWQHQQELLQLHGLKQNGIEVITNGYDEADFAEPCSKYSLYPDKVTISFVGSFYFGFKEIVLQFLDAVEQAGDSAEVVFIGKVSKEMGNVSRKNVTCINNIPKEKALAFSSSSDFLFLMVLPSAKWCIPGKIFEYLRLSKPILALVPEDGDAARIINEANAGFVLSYDVVKMREQLREIFEKHRKGTFRDFRPNQKYMAQFERAKQTERLAGIFDDVVEQTE
jgi:glycosyltransferase involved in cell wall biosynthesis